MNFTREPIIETIITPKEGFKLLVKNSKGGSNEEYSVDAVEVVSFGHSFFFRSLERPKSFLVPVSDYEVVEVKETRVVLKSATLDKSIKIGGGKAAAESAEQAPKEVEQRLEKKRERRRHRRRRATEPKAEEGQEEVAPQEAQPDIPIEVEPIIFAEDAVPMISRLIPPPTQLISETFKGKKELPPKEEEPLAEAEEKPKAKIARKPRRKVAKKEEEPSPEGGGEVKRVATETPDPVTATSYSTVDPLYPPFGSDLF